MLILTKKILPLILTKNKYGIQQIYKNNLHTENNRKISNLIVGYISSVTIGFSIAFVGIYYINR